MSLKSLILATSIAATSLPALGSDMTIMIEDAYARSGPSSGAAFFTIMNHGESDDRLISAASEVAKRVELHTHIMEDGIAKMREVEAGFAVAAGEMHPLQRGGDHVMFLGLDAPFVDGETISVTLTFEKAGDIVVQIPVDNTRKDAMKMEHGEHKHSH